MSTLKDYYNNFNSDISKIDAKYNCFDKISGFLPPLNSKLKILDIGCGYGSVSENLIRMGHDVYGIEINKEALKELKKKGFKTIACDITNKLPFGNNSFDGILLLDILEHVFDPISLLSEIRRVLKRNGFIIINTPLYFDLLDRMRILFTGNIISYDNKCYGKKLFRKFKSFNYGHIRFFQSKDLFHMLKITGFRIEKYKYIPMHGFGYSRVLGLIILMIANNWTVNLLPNLLAHSIKIRAVK